MGKSETIQELLVDFMKGYYFVTREVLYDILIQIGILMKLVRLMKMCLNETHIRVRLRKHLSDMFPTKNSVKKRRCFIAIAFQLCFKMCH
jgi:hypothetical protein